MNDKKILYFLSKNARIKRKEIANLLRMSPQLVGYTIDKLEQDIIQKYTTAIDSAKFGLLDLVIFFTYKTYDKAIHKKIESELKEIDNVVLIEKLSNGADLKVHYSIPNLSFFNKIHSKFMQDNKDMIKTIGVYPIIVRHKFTKEYLSKSKRVIDNVLSGDREPIILTKVEKQILKELKLNSTNNITNIAEKINIDYRTAIKIKKKLEKEKIIKQYTTIINYKKLGVESKTLLIVSNQLSPEKINHFLDYAQSNQNITSVTKLIGAFSLMVTIESFSRTKEIIDDLRQKFEFYDFNLYDNERILKDEYIPNAVLENEK